MARSRESPPEPAPAHHGEQTASLDGNGGDDESLSSGQHGVLFAPGTLVGGRYLVARFIARGGMGEVYEAEDVALRERIALKVVRSETASDPRASERLKRELHLARKVTHPNVCRIYDLCFHELGAGESLPVLTMELLQGETLAVRLRRDGALPLDEAGAIARQVAAGLDAAHEQGIVHRDLKSENVFLVAGRRSGEPRVVVTDFGLARSNEGPAITQGSGRMIGSPAYMAPEQVEGGEVGPPADLYAFGIVLYELTTGRRPFDGQSLFEVAFKRLRDEPPPPRGHRAELPASWEAAILRLMARAPAGRPATAMAAVATMEPWPAGAPTPTANPLVVAPRQAARGYLIPAALLALVGLVGLGLWGHVRGTAGSARGGASPRPVAMASAAATPEAGGAATPVRPRRSVAVLGFHNLAGRNDQAWLSTAMALMLSTELGAGEQLRLIPGETVARVTQGLALERVDSLAADTLARLRAALGADYVVLGSYFARGRDSGGKVRLDLRLQDASSGETLASMFESGEENDLPGLAARVGARLRERLGVTVSADVAQKARESLPSNTDAERLYVEGLGHLRLWEADKARDKLQRSLASDDSCPLAHAALAEALSELGFDDKAQAEARRAFELSGELSQEEKLLVEGRYWQVMNEHDRAIDIFGTLFRTFPDDLEHGVELATVQMLAGRENDALLTIEQMRRLRPPASDDPRIDLLAAHIESARSEYERARTLAQAAADKARARGEWIFVAEARTDEGRAAMMLGEPEAGRAAVREAQRLYAAAGDRKGVASTHRLLANLKLWVDDIGGAIAQEVEELALWRGMGNHGMERSVLSMLAIDELLRGDVKAARRRQREARALPGEVGDSWSDHDGLRVQAMLDAAEGNLSTSRQGWEKLRQVGVRYESRSFEAFVLTQLAAVELKQGDLDGARPLLARAVELATAVRDQRRLALARYYLAQLALAEARPAEAMVLAREAAQIFERTRSPAAATSSALVAALAQARQGQIGEAIAAALPRVPALAALQPLELRLQGQIAAAELLAEAPGEHGAQARRLAATAVSDATHAGLVASAIEAQLALGEVEGKLGHTEQARVVLTALRGEARRLGFVSAARRAQALLESGAAGATMPELEELGAGTGETAQSMANAVRQIRRALPGELGRLIARVVERAAQKAAIHPHGIEPRRTTQRTPRGHAAVEPEVDADANADCESGPAPATTPDSPTG